MPVSICSHMGRSDDERLSSRMIGMVSQISIRSLVIYEAIAVQLSASKLLSVRDLQGLDS